MMKKKIDKSKLRRSFGKDRILYIQESWVRLMRKTNEFQVPLFNSIKKTPFSLDVFSFKKIQNLMKQLF